MWYWDYHYSTKIWQKYETGRSRSGKLNRNVSDIKRDFRDGVNMILLVGMLEGKCLWSSRHTFSYTWSDFGILGFFLPLYCYNQGASTTEEMTENWRVCIIQSDLLANEVESMGIGGLTDLARGDLKATLRILYSVMIHHEEKKRRIKVWNLERILLGQFNCVATGVVLAVRLGPLGGLQSFDPLLPLEGRVRQRSRRWRRHLLTFKWAASSASQYFGWLALKGGLAKRHGATCSSLLAFYSW